MGMDQELAAMYGTPTAVEDQEKVAEAQLFAKLAAENGLDLTQFNDDQIQELWNATFSKQASTEVQEQKPDEEEKIAAAARAEFQAHQEWQEKVAECDKLGRVMAHAYVQELGLIDQQLQKQAEGEEEEKEETKEEEKKEEKTEEKEASAIDLLAAREGVELAKQAGIDPAVAARRIEAVLVLGGPGQSEKIASARSLHETVHIRALEFLERAGYPVQWAK